MQGLNKYELDFNKTLSGFLDIADGGNTLSEIVINNIEFEKGKFYTLMPKDTNLEKIYKFKLGGILSREPEIEYSINEKKATYSVIPTIGKEISYLIKDYLQKDYMCIMDDVTRDFTNEYTKKHLEYLNKYIYFINDEIIYLINSNEVSLDIIENMLCKSRAIWHSLGILVDVKVDFSSKQLTHDDLKGFCEKTKTIFINAYDGEGYVFWERK